MIHAINEAMLAASSSQAASIVVKATLIMTLALISAWLMRGSRAAARHALLAASFGILPLLPIASIVEPPVRVRISIETPQQALPPALAHTIHSTEADAPSPTSLAVASAAAEAPRFSLSVLLLAVWIAGVALFLLPLVVGLWRIRSLRRSALPWRHGQSVADSFAREAGIRRRVEVLVDDALQGPTTCGVLHPAILLPQDAQNWDLADLNRAMIHELEHVRRGDWVSHCFARTVCALYWFHPIVWIAWRQLTLAAERSCDDAVLGHSEATAYADQLVGLAQRLSAVRKLPALAMANRSDLSARVGAVLDNRQRRGRAGMWVVALACSGAALLVLTVSPLRLVAGLQDAAPVAVSAAASGPAGSPRSTGTSFAPKQMAQLAPGPGPADTAVNATLRPRFSASTMLVQIDLTAKDPSGKVIEGLQADDFAVTEDGRPQTLAVFEFQKLDDAPVLSPLPSVSSYYLLGYYTPNGKMDGAYRRISVTLRDGATAKLDYRAGYYTTTGGAPNFTIDGVANMDTGSNIASPVLIVKVDPEYSEQARKAKYSGTVVLKVEVDASGRVADLRVIQSLGMGLDEKAVEAVQKWKFRPGMTDGNPVTSAAEVEVNFRLL